jgi:hypothetical protein
MTHVSGGISSALAHPQCGQVMIALKVIIPACLSSKDLTGFHARAIFSQNHNQPIRRLLPPVKKQVA